MFDNNPYGGNEFKKIAEERQFNLLSYQVSMTIKAIITCRKCYWNCKNKIRILGIALIALSWTPVQMQKSRELRTQFKSEKVSTVLMKLKRQSGCVSYVR